ncbi:MAG: FAD-binding protein [Solirubrobacterales bacterium]|nr:FAD-binding protein [Solirubrobacterales bacterium]
MVARDPKYDVLFEPIELGPKTLPNRFWQVPHCNGAGSERPGMQAEFRAVKAEGGWGAVFTEVCVMTPDGDVTPWVGARLWDEGDIRNLSLMCDRIHDHDALAGVEMAFPGGLAQNAETRAPGRVVSQIPSDINPMGNGRELGKDEIRQLRREHVEGAKRARAAGFDLLTVYCSLGTFPMYFLYPFYNKRTDEYGGSFENRMRFTRELLEELHEEIDDCAIGCRFAIDTLEEPYGYGDLGIRHDGEGVGFVEALDDLVDYWDLNIGTLNWGEDAGSSRFFPMNHQADYVRIAKSVSKKACINVGRFTDPDVMVDAINSGQCDVIGAARPSIADPWLPRKIEEGRPEDIRECIGCNVCVSRWEMGGPPIWCTQNATSGEEYRRGWHPEKFSKATNAENDVLIVGAGPAGMECATVLGKRGMRRVHIVDANEAMGGHLGWVTRLPGLGTWSRVTQYREGQIDKLSNVQFVPKTELALDDVLEYGAEIVIVATGSKWDPVGMSGPTHTPVEGVSADADFVFTPEKLFVEGKKPGERVIVYDTDGYYMGASVSEALAADGHKVTYVTHLDTVGSYMRFTLEEQRQYQRLVELGVELVTQSLVLAAEPGKAALLQVWSGAESQVEIDSIVMVTQRNSESELYDKLISEADLEEAGIGAVYAIGDAWSPGLIAQSVFSGHRLAREIDSPDPSVPLPFIRERRVIGNGEDTYTLDSSSIAVPSA